MVQAVLIIWAVVVIIRLPGKWRRMPQHYPGVPLKAFMDWNSMDIASDVAYIAGVAVGFVLSIIFSFYQFFLFFVNQDNLSGIIGSLLSMIIPLIPAAIMGTIASNRKIRAGIR
jgi:hypothetical protein